MELYEAESHSTLATANLCEALPVSGEQITDKGPFPKIVQAVAGDQSSIDVVPDPSINQHSLLLSVKDSVVKHRLKQLRRGHHGHIVYSADSKASKTVLIGFFTDTVSVPRISRAWVIASAATCLLLADFVSGFKLWIFIPSLRVTSHLLFSLLSGDRP
jgi:hypothetical protein